MKNHQNIWEKLDHVVTLGDYPEVLYGKPNLDIFLIAARRFSSPPKDINTVLVFEDSPLGIEEAIATGMQTVRVSQPDEPPEDASESIASSDKNCVTRCKGLADNQPQLFGIPAF
ncbi:Pseudouridine-5'-monophosphatase [Fasciola gigantica]|uniref:Pseudouridine-5'-monophosphatase n=1 Tax=Fasciola gigantica TaxID=46835 RepID=A0A504YYF2_FASGI|nr:Pseudouridine-5'-monophosphatase [Fasciola gigantica]